MVASNEVRRIANVWAFSPLSRIFPSFFEILSVEIIAPLQNLPAQCGYYHVAFFNCFLYFIKQRMDTAAYWL